MDEIQGEPNGVTSYPQQPVGSFCAVEMCSPGSCPSCAVCVQTGGTPAMPTTQCLRECEYGTTGEDTCPGELGCGFFGFCLGLDAFLGEDRCRVSRRDTDMDGDIQAPTMMGEAAVDQLVWDDSAGHYLDEELDRCRHMGTEGAAIGDGCGWDGDCTPDGECLYGVAFQRQWNDPDDMDPETTEENGYCSLLGCQFDDIECGEGAACIAPQGLFPLCLSSCTVGNNEGEVTDPEYLFSQNADCRPGYSCLWDGETGADMGPNGGCYAPPAEDDMPNTVRTPNIGTACEQDSECWSPLGLGQCLELFAASEEDQDICTLFQCDTPLPGAVSSEGVDLCGEGATCAGFSVSSIRYCRQTCETPADCAVGQACLPEALSGVIGISPDIGAVTFEDTSICVPFCFGQDQAAADAQCKEGEVCMGYVAPMPGAGGSAGTCAPMM